MRQNSHPRHVWCSLARKLWPGAFIFILIFCTGDLVLVPHKSLNKSNGLIFCIRRLCVEGKRKMPIFAILNLFISGRVQTFLTEFGMLIKPPRLHFCAKAQQDRSNQFGAIDGEYMSELRKMAIFAGLNPHISSEGQPTLAKFGKLVETPG